MKTFTITGRLFWSPKTTKRALSKELPDQVTKQVQAPTLLKAQDRFLSEATKGVRRHLSHYHLDIRSAK